MRLIPILLIVAIVLLVARSKGRLFPVATGTGTGWRDPVRLILLVVVVLLLIGLVVNLVAPLGNYSVR
jgi:hypothetical protein